MRPFILAAGLAVLLLPQNARSDQGMLPAYDLDRTCADQARRAGSRDGIASRACIDSETKARAKAAELWEHLLPSARQHCKRLSERRESFLILSACVEREAAIQR